jgi:hypothetical protein
MQVHFIKNVWFVYIIQMVFVSSLKNSCNCVLWILCINYGFEWVMGRISKKVHNKLGSMVIKI